MLDLHPVFEDVAGTYLNLDGHWSESGVELAASAIVEHLNSQLEFRTGWMLALAKASHLAEARDQAREVLLREPGSQAARRVLAQ